MTLRVLVVHNAYQQRGGEDVVVEAESQLLAARGHAVELFLRHNDAIRHTSRGALLAQTFWSMPAASAFDELARRFEPDVVHVHNTFPLVSPSVHWAAGRLGVPVVQTLHNFRLLCPQATFLRDGRACEDCLGNLPWRGALHACYRGSRAHSVVLAGMLTAHRAIGTWQRKVARFIALNEFCRRKFIAGGLPPDRIVVKPNFVDLPAPPLGARSGFLYVGRLSHEKGPATLAQAAASTSQASVRVVGVGPEASVLDGLPNVRCLGELAPARVRDEMTKAAALVLPSMADESFPRTLVEAYACGLPVIASRAGALAELVEDGVTGLLFERGSHEQLSQRMRWALAHPERMAAMGRQARARYEARYTADANYRQLIDIYDDAVAESAMRR